MGIHVPDLGLVVNIGKECWYSNGADTAALPRTPPEPVEGCPADWQGWQGEGQPGSLCYHPLAGTEK